jgi:trimeric autotransporter adhesin
MNIVSVSILLKKTAFLLSLLTAGLVLVGCGGKDKKNDTVTMSSSSSSHVFVPTSSTLSSITYVKASNTEANDWFGWSVAISGDGNTMAVGAPAEDSNAVGVNGNEFNNDSANAGAVYVYKKVNGQWQQQAYLKASNTEQPNSDAKFVVPFNVRFGYRISLSNDGNTLAVSALLENTPAFGINCDQTNPTYTDENSVTGKYPYNIGAVYLFKRMDEQWSQSAYIKPTTYAPSRYADNSTYLQFGNSLALSGDGKTLAVGAAADSFGSLYTIVDGQSTVISSEANNSSTDSSSDASSEANSSSANACRYLQTSVSSTANSSTISKTASSSNSSTEILVFGGTKSGAVYVYKEVEGIWTADADLKAADATAYDYFGESLSLSDDGNTLVVGATGDDTKDSVSEVNELVSINDFLYKLDNGAAYIFARTNNEWKQAKKIKPELNNLEPLSSYNQQFGASVAISADGSTIAVGAPNDWSNNKGIIAQLTTIGTNAQNNTGAAYLFTGTGSVWSQQAYIKSLFPHLKADFGSTVALSKTGDILAVGAPGDSSQAKGINGDEQDHSLEQSGAAYLFTRSGSAWTQKSYIKAPNTDLQDRFARALGLDALGDTLVIGAYRESSNAKAVNGDKENDSATAAGAVYVY